MIKAIPVFYSDEVVAESDSFGPSAGKPKSAVEAWLKAAIPIEIFPIVPATIDELAAAHDRQYVEDILACRVDNGFGNRRPDVARSLPECRRSIAP